MGRLCTNKIRKGFLRSLRSWGRLVNQEIIVGTIFIVFQVSLMEPNIPVKSNISEKLVSCMALRIVSFQV